MINILSKLNTIQTQLKAPKGQYNSFSKYNYRSCEDILEGLKPLLDYTKTAIIIKDEVEVIGDRYYVKATATLYCIDTGESISNTALAREEEQKKGMDASQVTGATSSYARKYSLNGLLAIDDTKDADTKDNREEGQKKKAPIVEPSEYKINKTQIQALKQGLERTGVEESVILQFAKVKALDDMDYETWHKTMQRLEKTADKPKATEQVNLGL